MNVYEQQAKQIKWQVRKLDWDARLTLAITGMVGELSETEDARTTAKLNKDNYDSTPISEELGDFLWYVSLMCMELNIDFRELVEVAAEDKWSFQYIEPLRHFGYLSEMVKKVAITKKKKLDEFPMAKHHLQQLMLYTMSFMPLDDTYEDILQINYDKLVVRHGEPGVVT